MPARGFSKSNSTGVKSKGWCPLAKGHHPLDFTPVLLDFENPRAGIMRDADAPRFSHVYAVLRNRIGLLVEDHAWDPYAKRVQTSKDVLSAALDVVSKKGPFF